MAHTPIFSENATPAFLPENRNPTSPTLPVSDLVLDPLGSCSSEKFIHGFSTPPSAKEASGNAPSQTSQSCFSETVKNKSSSAGQLGDLVNHQEAHEKYRAQTTSPSDGEDVRWYFGKGPLSPNVVAASVPATEVSGKSDYLRFSIRDSLALEAAFLEREEELVSAWWKEYAECSEGPVIAAVITAQKIDNVEATGGERPLLTDNGLIIESYNNHQLYEDEDDIIGVPVKGGLYEVDLWRRRCYPVYWRGEHRRVLRGHWHAQKGGVDWLPLREDISEQLEFAYRSKIWHRRTFQPSGQFAARVNLQGATQGLHALFTGEDDTWEAWLDTDVSGISLVLGLKGSGVKLRRGFTLMQAAQPAQDELQQCKEEEMDDYCSEVPVHHLVFMVHGIGQRLEKANLVDDVGTFRHLAATLVEQHLSPYQRNTQRVLFIPCQWRRGLKLGGEDAVEDCTLEGVRALRTMLSATAHDVLYYMSPVYCQDIIDSVSGQLNKLYGKFMKRNPGYNGKVSIYGHSLGSVLSYDILCHQDTLTSAFPIDRVDSSISRIDDDDAQFSENLSVRPEDNTSMLGCNGQQRDTRNSASSSDPVEATSHPDNCLFLGTNLKDFDGLREEVTVLKAKLRAMEEELDAKRKGNCRELNRDYCNQCLKRSHEGSEPITPEVEGESLLSEFRKGKESIVVGAEQGVVAESKKRANGLEDPNFAYDNGQARLRNGVNSRKRHPPQIEYTKLAFEVDTFFAVGSPIGVFLALRNVRLGIGKGKEYWQDDSIEEEMPACKRMLNIFHPYDPVAYRIEPLVCKEYVNKRPVFVPYHRGGKRLHIGMQELGEDLSARSKAFVSSLHTVGNRMVRVFSTGSNENRVVQSDTEKPKERSYGFSTIERLTGDSDGRIDYMLQDAPFEHQYIQAISSHTSYWRDADTALFIIKHLYHDISEPPPSPNAETSLQNLEIAPLDTGSLKPVDESDSGDDDEGSFTFSNKEEVIATMSSLEKERM